MPVEQTLTRSSLLLVAAHPDDETIGAGGLLPRMKGPTLVHVTDGAPRNPADAVAAGYPNREEYARARRQELLNALELAGIPPERTESLNLVDQEVSLEMAYASLRLVDLMKALRPAVVLTHPYEGGHPDHDAVAFAVHAACALANPAPRIYEFTSYHSAGNGAEPRLESGRFIPGQDEGAVVVLSESDRLRKQRMADCFATQAHMLRQFAVDAERFRPAPAYDFSEAPHSGRLFYEYFEWGMTGQRWRELAASALETLGLPAVL